MTERACATCKFAELNWFKEPCSGCVNFENWADASTVSVDEFKELIIAVEILTDNLTRVVTAVEKIVLYLDKQK